MSSLQQTQYRLWAEQLRSLVSGRHGSLELETEQTRRLLIAAYVVLMKHQIDRRGRCRLCRGSRAWWWPGKQRTCTVYVTFMVAMGQPFKTVSNWLQDH